MRLTLMIVSEIRIRCLINILFFLGVLIIFFINKNQCFSMKFQLQLKIERNRHHKQGKPPVILRVSSFHAIE